MPTKFAQIDGIAVHYVHAGRTTLPGVVPDLSRGELFLFLHDAGGNAGIWRHVTAILEKDHSVIAFDFPGHGRSGGTESLGSIGAYAAFVEALVRTLGLRPVVLVGHGMGAAVALQTAANAPQTVRGLALVGAARRLELAQETLTTWRDVSRGRTPQPFTTEMFSPRTDFGIMREAWMEQVKTDPRVRYFDLVGWEAWEAGPAATQIRTPTALMTGGDDQMTPPAAAEQLRQAIQGATLVTIADAGHMLPMEKPAELAAAIASEGR